jgi:hypothetical protein
MQKRSSKKKQPDHQQLARKVLDTVVPDVVQPEQIATDSGKNPAAVALGKLGGKKGGPARAKKLSKARRSEIAKKAAAARWNSRKPKRSK